MFWPFFDFALIFGCHNQRMERINDFFGVTISSHIISFSFLSLSGHLWTNQENQNWLTQNRRISCIWGENFRSSQKERFVGLIGKSPYIVNYLGAGVRNYVCSITLVITEIYIFPLLYFTSVLLLIMRSQPSLIAWTVTSTAAFYLCWSTQNILVYELDLFYI